jgi:hypothetical protein
MVVGEREGELGADFTFNLPPRIVELASISIAHCNCFEFQLGFGDLW